MKMEFWKKLKYWQKGAIVGAVVGIFPIVSFLFDNHTISEISDFIFYYPRQVLDVIVGCGLCGDHLLLEVIFLFLISAIQWGIIGAIIGLIIEKFKNQKKVSQNTNKICRKVFYIFSTLNFPFSTFSTTSSFSPN